MASKIDNYSRKYGITSGIANAIVNIIKNEVECNDCLDIVTIGDRPENVNFAIYFNSEEPASAVSGDLWVDTDNGSLYIYNGTTWDTGFRWDFENGITNVSGNVKLGGTLMEDTTIDSTTYDLNISTEDATAPGEILISRIFTGDKSFDLLLSTQMGNDVAVLRRVDLTDPLDYKVLSVNDTSVALIGTNDISATMNQIAVSNTESSVSHIDMATSANNSSVRTNSGQVQLDATSVIVKSPKLTTDETTTFNFIPDTLTTLNIGADTTTVNVGKTGSTANVKGALVVDNALTLNNSVKILGTLQNATDDATAAGLGVSVGELYRNGSILMIRVV